MEMQELVLSFAEPDHAGDKRKRVQNCHPDGMHTA